MHSWINENKENIEILHKRAELLLQCQFTRNIKSMAYLMSSNETQTTKLHGPENQKQQMVDNFLSKD